MWLDRLVNTGPLVAVFCLLAGMTAGAMAESICVDEILLEQDASSDPIWQKLAPKVDMTFHPAENRLTVILRNEACYSGVTDAGHLLTGVGFNLPSGVSIEDAGDRNSWIWLPAGAVIIDPKPKGTSRTELEQDDWGYASGGAAGHFATEAKLATNTVLSSMKSDVRASFGGLTDNNDLSKAMGSFDYGLQGLPPTPGHAEKPAIRSALAIELYLSGPPSTDWDGLLSYIEDHPVVVSYGSPGTSQTMIPEPAVMAMILAGSVGLAAGRRRRAG